jgi:hypothetical protein
MYDIYKGFPSQPCLKTPFRVAMGSQPVLQVTNQIIVILFLMELLMKWGAYGCSSAPQKRRRKAGGDDEKTEHLGCKFMGQLWKIMVNLWKIMKLMFF